MPTDIPIESPEIFEIRQFADTLGRRILMKCRPDGDPVEYLGQSMGRIDFENGTAHQWQYSFKIAATSVEDAYAKFTQTLKDQWPAQLAERQSFLAQEAATARKRIVVAHEGQRPAGVHA